jgi:hypothetical protein
MNTEVSKYISHVWNYCKWDMQHSAVCKIYIFDCEMQQLAVIKKWKRFYKGSKADAKYRDKFFICGTIVV